jgi:RimJ/RimL family protein N-acetyltransferase
VDDRVVGSVSVHIDGIHHDLDAKVDPLYGERGQRWKGQALALVGDWLVSERGQPVALCHVPADEAATIAELERGEFRQVACFREMVQRAGSRVDRLAWERHSPSWIERLGDPREVPLERTGTGEPRPVPPPLTLEVDPPANAMMIGSRVYLRPEDPKKDPEASVWQARQETETFFDIGRHLTSASRLEDWIKSHEKGDLPNWITFAVCLRENDELIGWVALLDVDYQNRFAETGSFFGHPDYRGSGYGSEAKQLLLEYAFERLGLHMVQSWVYFPNTRSAAALRKQGYRESGRIHWVYPYEGGLGSFVVFDLLAEEWRAMPRQAWTPS